MPINVKHILRTYFLTLFVGIITLFLIIGSIHEPNRLQIYFFDVGQGDSILIRTPDRHTILVDGGPDQTVIQKISSVLPWYDRTIDLMILTHPHADHINGLIAVLDRYDVTRVFFTDIKYNSPIYQIWRAAVTQEGSEIIITDHLDSVDLGGGVVAHVLYPNTSLSGKAIYNLNDSSIVFELFYDNFSTLFTGDQEQEEALTRDGLIQPVTVLKVGHHGSRNASDALFLATARPALAVISVGANNRYKHPHPEILERLAVIGTKIMRTDRDGDVIVESDGRHWWIVSH